MSAGERLNPISIASKVGDPDDIFFGDFIYNGQVDNHASTLVANRPEAQRIQCWIHQEDAHRIAPHTEPLSAAET